MKTRRSPRASSTPDVGRLSRAVQRPGIDPRIWALRGWVTRVYVDADHGPLVDVLLQTGEEDTARVGQLYAGPGYGDYAPIDVDDEVLLVAAMGNYNSGLVVVARLYSRSDPPPAEAAQKPLDRVLRIKKDQTLRLIVEGTGQIVLRVGDQGQVLLGDETGLQPGALGTDLEQRVAALESAFNTHTHVFTASATFKPAAPGPPDNGVAPAGTTVAPLPQSTGLPKFAATRVQVK